MPSLESYLKANSGKVEFLKWFVLPVLVAAAFFFLDGRYIAKDDWKAQTAEQRALITNLGNEQKTAFTGLTKAITALADEQRNTAEFQRNNASSIATLANTLDKYQTLSEARWEKTLAGFEKTNLRLDKDEAETAKQNIILEKTTETVNKIGDKVNVLETTSAKHDVGIQMNADALVRMARSNSK
jgi:hypothetical protein